MAQKLTLKSEGPVTNSSLNLGVQQDSLTYNARASFKAGLDLKVSYVLVLRLQVLQIHPTLPNINFIRNVRYRRKQMNY